MPPTNRSDLPADAVVLSRNQRLALAAVVDHGARTVREVMTVVGWWSPSTAHVFLTELRAVLLVAWEDGKAGTLRPAVRVVA